MYEKREKVYLINGKTDMRKGIDGLAAVVAEHEGMNIFDEHALFLFCGRKKDRYKALMWEKDGFILSYKRLESGKLQWPKEKENRIEKLSMQQFRWLLEGLSVIQPRSVENAQIGYIF